MKPIKNQLGFSLIELIVSLVILGILIVPVGLYFGESMETSKSSRQLLQANQLAQKYIELIKTTSYEKLANEFVKVSDDKYTKTYIETNMKDTTIDVELIRMEGSDKLDNTTVNDFINGIESDWDTTLESTKNARTIDISYKNDNTLSIVENGIETIVSNIKHHSIKLICKGYGTNNYHNINITNQSAHKVKVCVLKEVATTSIVNVNALQGEIIRSVNTIPNNFNKDLLYAVNVTVKQNKKVLATLNATKNND